MQQHMLDTEGFLSTFLFDLQLSTPKYSVTIRKLNRNENLLYALNVFDAELLHNVLNVHENKEANHCTALVIIRTSIELLVLSSFVLIISSKGAFLLYIHVQLSMKFTFLYALYDQKGDDCNVQSWDHRMPGSSSRPWTLAWTVGKLAGPNRWNSPAGALSGDRPTV
jgi:hypothetical protein